jgi:hypothetical protein
MPLRFALLLAFILLIALVFDFYGYQLLKAAFKGLSPQIQRAATALYWLFPIATALALVYTAFTPMGVAQTPVKAWFTGLYFAQIVFAILIALFATVDDVRRLLFAGLKFLGVRTHIEPLAGLALTRSAFLSRAALTLAAVPAVGMLYGVARGGHRYQVHRKKIFLPNLPQAFEGFKIVQLSDIHAGSFFSRQGVQKGIDLVKAQNADMVVFTGDLVNNLATEIEPWVNHFKQISAPHGVYSILGNHDYGDYAAWESPEAKAANLRRLIDNPARMGWDILIDENRRVEKDGQHIALIGIQNWGARAHFPKYGDLTKAYLGAEASPIKILLSHDPSHWHAQVRPQFPAIDLMLAGHTHGMQFGIDNEVLKWSPVQYVYKEWAGLYKEGSQQLYVNRGFGFIGYPGRFGIWPEVTVLELTNKPIA